jgi:hypothetical protein
MKRLQGLAVAFALACVPGVSAAQDAPDQYDDTAATASASVEYDGGQGVDSEGRRIDGDERYDDERYEGDRYEDRRYGGGGDSRYDDRYPRDDSRYDERYDRDRRYGGDCRRKADRATPVLGFILGGLISNQFGHGAGRAAATAVGAHLGHQVARDAVNNCEDRYGYGYGYRGRGYGPSMSFGIGVFGGGHRSAYSLSFGAPFAYGYGYPGEYWRYRYQARPWRWGHPRY